MKTSLATHKKGQLGTLLQVVVALAGIAIALTVAYLVLAQGLTQAGNVEGLDMANNSQCITSYTCNATNEVRSALTTVPSWLSLIILVVIGGILVGLIVAFRKFSR